MPMYNEEEYEERQKQTAAMKEDLESGMPPGEVMVKYDISKSALYDRFNRRLPKPTGVTKKELEKVQRDEQTVNMYADSLRGMTMGEIATKYGLTVTTVSRRLKDLNIDLTPAAVQVYRQQEYAKLNLLENKLWSALDKDYYVVNHGKVIIDPDTGTPMRDINPVLSVADRLLKIQDRRAKLGGFDAPTKVEVDHSVTEIQVTEIKDLVEQARRDQLRQEEMLRRKELEDGAVDAEIVDEG